MEWTTDKPAKSGWYWVMAYELCYGSPYPDRGPEMYCVRVDACKVGDRLFIYFDLPAEGCESINTIGPDYVTHWMGPIQQPEPPTISADQAQKANV